MLTCRFLRPLLGTITFNTANGSQLALWVDASSMFDLLELWVLIGDGLALVFKLLQVLLVQVVIRSIVFVGFSAVVVQLIGGLVLGVPQFFMLQVLL